MFTHRWRHDGLASKDGSRALVREVLLNLLTNALQYNTREVKDVDVGYRAPDEAPRFHDAPPRTEADTIFFVRGNGIGIEPKHAERVFAMFRRLHGRDEVDGGTGAGLTIVKRLIERHGGQVWLASTPGEGSTFYFTLPAADRDDL